MSLIWAGGEDIDVATGTAGVNTTAANYHPYARCALYPSTDGGFVLLSPFPGGAITSCWYGHYYRIVSGGPWTNQKLFGLGKSGTSNLLCIYHVSNYKLALGTWDGSTLTNLQSEAGASLPTWPSSTRVDIQVTSFSDTVNGNCKVYINGSVLPIIDFTGDMTLSGFTSFDCVYISGRGSWSLHSGIFVQTTDSRPCAVRVHYPNAAGDANGWDSGGYAEVDEVTLNDTDVMYVDSSDADAQLNLLNCPSGSFDIRGAIITTRAALSADATMTGIALGIKSGGSYDYGSKQALSTSWQSVSRIMDVNPITTNPFTQAEIDALQLNLRAKA